MELQDTQFMSKNWSMWEETHIWCQKCWEYESREQWGFCPDGVILENSQTCSWCQKFGVDSAVHRTWSLTSEFGKYLGTLPTWMSRSQPDSQDLFKSCYFEDGEEGRASDSQWGRPVLEVHAWTWWNEVQEKNAFVSFLFCPVLLLAKPRSCAPGSGFFTWTEGSGHSHGKGPVDDRKRKRSTGHCHLHQWAGDIAASRSLTKPSTTVL